MIGKKAVCLNCIDGRVQIPAIDWIKDQYALDCVDMITEPGMDGLLSDNDGPIDAVIRKIEFCIEKNNISMIFIVGHYDCKGNPVSELIHKEQICRAAERLKSKFSNIEIIRLWINEQWTVEKLPPEFKK